MENLMNNFNFKFNSDGLTITGCKEGVSGDVVIPDVVNGDDNTVSYVTEIADAAFRYNSCITSVIIPESVTRIGNSAFSNCTRLENVVLPSGLTDMGYNAFFCCTSLKEITIPDKLSTINMAAFACCESLTDVTLPKSISRIDDMAFSHCTSLEFIAIPQGVTRIEDHAFFGCKNLKSISLPAGLTEIGSGIFWGCSSLTDITVDKNNPVFSSNAGVLFDKNQTELIWYPMGKTEKMYAVPDRVTTISSHAFAWNKNLAVLAMPETVTEIGEYAFICCEKLRDIFYFGSAEVWEGMVSTLDLNESVDVRFCSL